MAIKYAEHGKRNRGELLRKIQNGVRVRPVYSGNEHAANRCHEGWIVNHCIQTSIQLLRGR